MERNGGRPKKITSGFENEKTKTKPNVNDNENVNVNDNVNENDNASDSCVDGSQVDDSCVDGLQDVIDFYNNNIGFMTPFILETITDYVKSMGKDIVLYAMQISVEANKKTIQYIKAILNNWQKAGIKTLAEAKEESKKKSVEKKTGNAHNFNEREYSEQDFNSLYINL